VGGDGDGGGCLVRGWVGDKSGRERFIIIIINLLLSFCYKKTHSD
jgi:hypothetical protein